MNSQGETLREEIKKLSALIDKQIDALGKEKLERLQSLHDEKERILQRINELSKVSGAKVEQAQIKEINRKEEVYVLLLKEKGHQFQKKIGDVQSARENILKVSSAYTKQFESRSGIDKKC